MIYIYIYLILIVVIVVQGHVRIHASLHRLHYYNIIIQYIIITRIFIYDSHMKKKILKIS